MGDLIGDVVDGVLLHVPRAEFQRILAAPISATERAGIFADLCRINALYMIANAGSGHIGSSFSSLDIIAWLKLEDLSADGLAPDIMFSSKGHDAPAFYAAMTALGQLDFDLIHQLRRRGGLPGHPDVATPGVVTNTGSLGMGISKAKGMAMAGRLKGQRQRVVVLTGDGELQEGQNWEALISAANLKMGELTVIVDHNKLQSDTLVSRTSDLGDLPAKFAAFGWAVERCDGHDLPALAAALARLAETAQDRPKVVIADTIKGRGVAFMEHTSVDSDVETYKYHSGAPDEQSYSRAAAELVNRVNRRLTAAGVDEVEVASIERPQRPPVTDRRQMLVAAYGRALVDQAERIPALMVLDADLAIDCGLMAFKQRFPERFVECGIAEQDMVSQAGGMALMGVLPVVHSFACFLSSRPNEHIYNNATERTRIVYVASLAGVVPGGPGHSHQAVRDISSLAAVPGLVMVEPSTEAEVAQVVDHCFNKSRESSYIRLISVPWPVPFTLPADYVLEPGRGVAITQGDDAVLISSGPVMLSEAWKAAGILKERGIGLKVINLPWLNRVDTAWLRDAVGGAPALFTLDNHFVDGGQGSMVITALAEGGLTAGRRIARFGLTDVPVHGTNDEVLAAHGLDAQSVAERIEGMLRR